MLSEIAELLIMPIQCVWSLVDCDRRALCYQLSCTIYEVLILLIKIQYFYLDNTRITHMGTYASRYKYEDIKTHSVIYTLVPTDENYNNLVFHIISPRFMQRRGSLSELWDIRVWSQIWFHLSGAIARLRLVVVSFCRSVTFVCDIDAQTR